MRISSAHLDFFKNVVWSIRKQVPYKLLFISTFSCNSRCVTCNNWKKQPEGELDVAEIRKIFSHIPFRISWLSITGGEPSLREDLVEIVDAALESFSSLRMVSIITNGLAREKVVHHLKRIMEKNIPFLFLRLSIDGPEHIHNKVRNIPDAFRKTMETYAELRDLAASRPHINLGLEITLSASNVEHLDTFLPELLSLHTVNISIAHKGYLYHNLEDDDAIYRPDREKVLKLLEYQNRRLSYFKISDLMQKVYLKTVPAFLKNPSGIGKNCAALKSSFGIDPQGNVIPCLMWDRCLGNLREVDYDIMKLWNDPAKETILREIEGKKCPGCWTPCEAYQKILDHLVKSFGLC